MRVLTLQLVEPGQQYIATEIRRCRQLQHPAHLVLALGKQALPLLQACQGGTGVPKKAFAIGRQAQVAGGPRQ
ncbi:hypothetical protein D3C80_2044620 [compost metagenome]